MEVFQEDAEDISFTCPNGCESASNAVANRKRGRFLLRCFRGIACGLAKGSRIRWFVFTESDTAKESGKDFGREFHRFVTWLRKVHCPDFEYIVVEHRQGDKQRRNWHVICYGSDKLPVLAIRKYWLKHFMSTVTGMAEIKAVHKAVMYVAGYLSSGEKFVRSWCSQGWVFPGWLGWSKWYCNLFSEYPSLEYVTKLSLMFIEQRENDWSFSEYLEEVKTMRDDWRPKAKTSARAIRTVCDRRGVLWHYDHNEGKWVEGRWTTKAKLKAVRNN